MKEQAIPQKQSVFSSRLWYFVGLAAILAGIAVHVYLTSVHFELKFGVASGDRMCNVGETFNCEAVAASRFSEFAGFPLALWGAATNSILLLMALLLLFGSPERQPIMRKNTLILAGFVAAASLVMGGIAITAMSTYCLFCIFAYVLSFIAFFGLRLGLPGKLPSSPLANLKGPAYKLSDAKPLLFAFLGIGAATFIADNGISKSYDIDNRQFNATINGYVNEWLSNPKLTIEPITPLAKGSSEADAKMTIVEFADYRCPHCAHAAPVLDAFVKSHPGTRLTFQAWPLDGECNSAISSSSGVSCALARAAHCADSSVSKGWQAQSWIFDRQREFISLEVMHSLLQKMSADLGLDYNELKTCMDAEATRKLIEQQAALGTRLNIQGTPSIFVNGRQLPAGQSIPVLKLVYEKIINGDVTP